MRIHIFVGAQNVVATTPVNPSVNRGKQYKYALRSISEAGGNQWLTNRCHIRRFLLNFRVGNPMVTHPKVATYTFVMCAS